jgi:hypothetical protein
MVDGDGVEFGGKDVDADVIDRLDLWILRIWREGVDIMQAHNEP